MNQFIKEKKILSLLSNAGKRKIFVQEDNHWNTIESSEHGKVRIQCLSYTPFIRIQLRFDPTYSLLPYYKTLGYYIQDKTGISTQSFTESDITHYLAQQVLENKKKNRGF